MRHSQLWLRRVKRKPTAVCGFVSSARRYSLARGGAVAPCYAPAMSASRRNATYDGVRNAPEHMVAEILEGELFLTPRPSSPHANAATVLGGELNGAFHRPLGDPKGPGGWWILFEPELHFAPDVVVPDLAGWRRDRVPVLPNTAAFTTPPDWVCEVVSPETAARDRGRKLRVYAREGIPHLWMVEPLHRTLEVYQLEPGHWVVASAHGGDDPVRAVPFDALELEMARWWLPTGTAVVAR